MANSSNDGGNPINSGPEILFRFSPEQIYKLVKLRIDMDDTHFAKNYYKFKKSWKIIAQELNIGADGPTCEDKWADCILTYLKCRNKHKYLVTRSEIEKQDESSEWMQILVEWLSTKDTHNPSSSNQIDGESQPTESNQNYSEDRLASDEIIKDIIKHVQSPVLAELGFPIILASESEQQFSVTDDDEEEFG